MFKRRVTQNPDGVTRGKFPPKNSAGMAQCPDVWELENGDYAIIGIRSTSALKPVLPESAGCGPDEEIVVVPKEVFENSRP
jgi:hypothetical protein